MSARKAAFPAHRLAIAPNPGDRVSARKLLVVVLTLALTAAVASIASPASAGVVTQSNDTLRTGWYGDQPRLSQQTVQGGTFGQLWSSSIEGDVWGSPLVANGTLFVTTSANN